MRRGRFLSLLIFILSLEVVGLQAQDVSVFLPNERLTREFLKRSADTKAALSYNAKAITWTLTINSPTDKLVYSQSADGVGNPTGSKLAAAPGGGIDPTISNPLKVINLTIFVHQRGSVYQRQDDSKPGTISTMAGLSSFQDLIPFIGVRAEIRFLSDEWLELGGKKYRKGGFKVGEAGLTFLPGTESLGTDGIVVVIGK